MKARARAWLALAAAAILLQAMGLAAAQSPRASLVQETARAWLAKTDRGDAPGSWQAAGAQFRNAITGERWAESLSQMRARLGPVMGRTVTSTQFRKTFPGAPDGDYAIIVFRTSFTRKDAAGEMMALRREDDGAWRVIAYNLIR